jgi:hypothetical protein
MGDRKSGQQENPDEEIDCTCPGNRFAARVR